MKKLITVGLIGLLLTGCAHEAANTASPAPTPSAEQNQALPDQTETTQVEIKGFAFSPKEITVAPGTEITVTNNDLPAHSLTSDTGAFDTGLITKDKSATLAAPALPGSYPFHCTPHPNMTGTLIVK